jgi:hypothetical protein
MTFPVMVPTKVAKPLDITKVTVLPDCVQTLVPGSPSPRHDGQKPASGAGYGRVMRNVHVVLLVFEAVPVMTFPVTMPTKVEKPLAIEKVTVLPDCVQTAVPGNVQPATDTVPPDWKVNCPRQQPLQLDCIVQVVLATDPPVSAPPELVPPVGRPPELVPPVGRPPELVPPVGRPPTVVPPIPPLGALPPATATPPVPLPPEGPGWSTPPVAPAASPYARSISPPQATIAATKSSASTRTEGAGDWLRTDRFSRNIRVHAPVRGDSCCSPGVGRNQGGEPLHDSRSAIRIRQIRWTSRLGVRAGHRETSWPS